MTPDKTIDVTGIGNAIVDVIARADDAFLTENGITKGAMTLIDSARATELYDRMGPGVEQSGGSAGNTIAGIAALGGKAAYIGKVHDDELGRVFRHDIRAIGVDFDSPAATDGPPTARCLILVTEDGELLRSGRVEDDFDAEVVRACTRATISQRQRECQEQ